MPNNVREEARNTAEWTRRLSDLTVDISAEARQKAQVTIEKVEHARQLLKSTDELSGKRVESLSGQTSSEASRRDAGKNPSQIIVIGGSAGSHDALNCHPWQSARWFAGNRFHCAAYLARMVGFLFSRGPAAPGRNARRGCRESATVPRREDLLLPVRSSP